MLPGTSPLSVVPVEATDPVRRLIIRIPPQRPFWCGHTGTVSLLRHDLLRSHVYLVLFNTRLVMSCLLLLFAVLAALNSIWCLLPSVAAAALQKVDCHQASCRQGGRSCTRESHCSEKTNSHRATLRKRHKIYIYSFYSILYLFHSSFSLALIVYLICICPFKDTFQLRIALPLARHSTIATGRLCHRVRLQGC